MSTPIAPFQTAPTTEPIGNGNAIFAKRWKSYSRFLERFPILFTCLIVASSLGCGFIAYMLHGLPKFDEPILGFEARGTRVHDHIVGLQNFFESDLDILSPLPLSHQIDRRKRETEETVVTTCPIPSTQLGRIVFAPVYSQTVLQVDILQSICQHDEDIRSNARLQNNCYRTHLNATCCPSWSLGQVIATLNNKESCLSITQSDIDMTLNLLSTCASYYKLGNLTSDCHNGSVCTGVPPECTRSNLVYMAFNYLLPNDFTESINTAQSLPKLTSTMVFLPIRISDKETSKDVYQKRIKGKEQSESGLSEIVGLYFHLKLEMLSELLLADFVFLGCGALVVFIIIWIYTESFFVTIAAILNIFMSFIVAYFLYFVVFRMKFFPFVNVVSVVLLIGIGADDTFIYMDIWRETRKNKYKFPDRVSALVETLHHASITMFVTSFTTSSTLFASMVSEITAIRCFASYAGIAVLVNFVYTITYLPAIVIISDKYFSFWDMNNLKSSLTVRKGEKTSSTRKIKERLQHLRSLPKKFFHEVLPKLVTCLRYVWIIFFVILAAGGFVLSFIFPKLGLPEKTDFQLFKQSHIFEQYDQVYKPQYPFESSEGIPMQLFFLWGVKAVDNGDHWNPRDRGYVVLDDHFEMSNPDAQTWLLEFCNHLRQADFYEEVNSNFCFMESFKNWTMQDCMFPFHNTCCNISTFPIDNDLFEYCAKQFQSVLCNVQECNKATPGLRFGSNDEIKALFVASQSTFRFTTRYAPNDELWHSLDVWMTDILRDAPSSLQGGWAISVQGLQLFFYDLQASLASGTTLSITISLVVASSVLLLTTGNIVLTIYAIFSIAGAVFVTVGCLVLLGWELNIFESAIMSLSVGLAVDFTIHYGVAYRLCQKKTRQGRTEYAIRTLSSAITMAALSTFTAGALMLPATVVNFVQLGMFLILVMIISWTYSTFFFLPLCSAFGPNEDFGQINFSATSFCCKSKKRITKEDGINENYLDGIVNPAFQKSQVEKVHVTTIGQQYEKGGKLDH